MDDDLIDDGEAADDGDTNAAANEGGLKPMTDKNFYKEMAKIKEQSRSNGTGVLPPKKSASAYIIF